MARRIVYEWIVEEIDEHDDIVDTSAWNSAAQALAHADRLRLEVATGGRVDVGLVRDEWSDMGDLVVRMWSYLDNDERLPATFTDGGSLDVPQRFAREMAAALAARGR